MSLGIAQWKPTILEGPVEREHNDDARGRATLPIPRWLNQFVSSLNAHYQLFYYKLESGAGRLPLRRRVAHNLVAGNARFDEEFRRSKSWIARSAIEDLRQEKGISDVRRAAIEARAALVPVAARELAIGSIAAYAQHLHRAARYCESPLEIVMLCALAVCASGDNVLFRHNGEQWGDKGLHDDLSPQDSTVCIEPQLVTPRRYRVDFLVTYTGYWPDHAHDRQGDDSDPIRASRRLIIECDGRDFHGRTPQQKSCERRREHYLIYQGPQCPVMHYTGSAIWKDVVQCAERSLSWLRSGVWMDLHAVAGIDEDDYALDD